MNILLFCYINNCAETFDVLSYIVSHQTGLNSVLEVSIISYRCGEGHNRNISWELFKVAFYILRCEQYIFPNILGWMVLILILFFFMLKKWKVLSTPVFPTMCWQPKSDYLVLRWEKQKWNRLRTKIKIVTHLWFGDGIVRRDGGIYK